MKTEKYTYSATSRTILADLYTPVTVYMRLRDIYAQSAMMESSDYHDAGNSRSFIGINPIASIAVNHNVATLSFPDGVKELHGISDSYTVADAIRQFIDCFEVSGNDAHFCGLYGYTAFNAVRYFEHIDVKDSSPDKNDAPDVLYILYREIIVFDHFKSTCLL